MMRTGRDDDSRLRKRSVELLQRMARIRRTRSRDFVPAVEEKNEVCSSPYPRGFFGVDGSTSKDWRSADESDELERRGTRLLERRRKQAAFRDPDKTPDNFDLTFNKKMNRSLVFDLATAAFISRREDALFLGPPGTGKGHLVQAIGQAAIQHRVLYRETHTLLEDITDATLDGTRREFWNRSRPFPC